VVRLVEPPRVPPGGGGGAKVGENLLERGAILFHA
jgi:hypothetical protein